MSVRKGDSLQLLFTYIRIFINIHACKELRMNFKLYCKWKTSFWNLGCSPVEYDATVSTLSTANWRSVNGQNGSTLSARVLRCLRRSRIEIILSTNYSLMPEIQWSYWLFSKLLKNLFVIDFKCKLLWRFLICVQDEYMLQIMKLQQKIFRIFANFIMYNIEFCLHVDFINEWFANPCVFVY